MRQVEVLHDHLLRRFDEDPTLQPRDVVVMTPDIEAFAPLIDAVFSEGRRGGADPGFPLLPFHLADRGLRSQNPVAETVARVLALPETRLAASDLLDLLALEPVRRRFGLAEDDLPAIRRWVDESGIRWGIDADDRVRHGQPAAGANTWRFGLDRLLLGYAMPGEDRTFGGVLPFDAVEGGLARTLGCFADACGALFARVRDLAAPRPLAAWSATLDRLLDDLVRTVPGEAWRVRQVQELGQRIADEAGDAFGGDVTLDAYRAILEEGFGTAGAGTGFLGGAVTFCAMVPLRAIPFRVVCLLGLDDGRFPRQRDRLAFDRMAGRPRPGDRTPRDDDNYMFLEALISARDSLAIFFTGQHIADNKELPPAVPVAELLDVVDATFATDSGRPARELLLRRHALQPFSPRNFEPGDPFSYDGRFLEGAKRLLGLRGEPPALFDGLLDEPVTARPDGGPEPLGVSPVEFLLKERLGLRFEAAAADLRDREPIELAPLEAYQVGDAVMRHLLDGTDPDAARALAVGRGELPLGSPGRVAFDAIVERAAPVVRVARAAREGRVETNCAVRFEHGPLRLEGTVEGIWGDGLIDVTYARVSARNRLRTWIRHVAASWAVPGFDGPSRCVALRADGKDGCQTVAFAPLGPDPEARRAAAAALLRRLLDLFCAGLRSPLPLLTKASAKYAETLRSKGDTSEGRAAARRAAAGAYGSNEARNQFGDDANPYVARVFGACPSFEDDVPVPGIPPGVAPGFHEVTLAVWGPLLGAQADGPRQGGGR
jgi:exodeoxyribonuclease V gamma subunit